MIPCGSGGIIIMVNWELVEHHGEYQQKHKLELLLGNRFSREGDLQSASYMMILCGSGETTTIIIWG